MDRLATILANFRRRDNIRDFIDGLEDSECWPYPDGETQSIPPDPKICFCCGECSTAEVMLREDKIEELTHLFLINVHRYHALAPFNRSNKHEAPLTDVSIELCPEEGPGAYTVSYEVVESARRGDAPRLDLHDVATIRSAFMHRYEWVINKLHNVNEDRREVCEMYELGLESAPELGDPIESENEAALSEEEDHDALQPDSDCSASTRLCPHYLPNPANCIHSATTETTAMKTTPSHMSMSTSIPTPALRQHSPHHPRLAARKCRSCLVVTRHMGQQLCRSMLSGARKACCSKTISKPHWSTIPGSEG